MKITLGLIRAGKCFALCIMGEEGKMGYLDFNSMKLLFY